MCVCVCVWTDIAPLYPVTILQSPDKFWFRGCKFQVKKCKEATGRVVMFRQMNITNSFTMEATFCGTTICRSVFMNSFVHNYGYLTKDLC